MQPPLKVATSGDAWFCLVHDKAAYDNLFVGKIFHEPDREYSSQYDSTDKPFALFIAESKKLSMDFVAAFSVTGCDNPSHTLSRCLFGAAVLW